ncbi:MAG: ComEC/Rec2 family competence protein [Clostridia bacterium]|nr:ComEC/Rec2 family competence protein [Clostridia bacterium]
MPAGIRRKIRTAPFAFIFAAAFVISFVFSGIYAEKTYRYGATEELGTVTGEAVREAWNAEEDFVFSFVRGGRRVRILVKCGYITGSEREEILAAGTVRASSVRARTPETARNFGEFDYARYLLSHGVSYYLYAREGEFVPAEAEKSVFHACMSLSRVSSGVRAAVSSCLAKYLDGGFAASVNAVMTGETGLLDRETKSNLAKAGFAHLMAVSGAHVSYFTMPFAAVMKRTLMDTGKRKLLLLVPVAFLWFVAGGTFPVTRAAVVFAYAAVAAALRKPVNTVNAIGLAGTLQLAVQPFAVFGTGFVLSYGAALSIAVILPVLRRSRLGKAGPAGVLLPGIAVNAGVLPVLMYVFNSFSPCGILLSAFASEIACALCVGGYALFFLDRLPFAAGVMRVAAKGLTGLSYVLEWIAGKIAGGQSWFLRVECGTPGIAFFVVYYILLLWLVAGCRGKILPFAAFAAAAVSVMFGALPKTEVLFFDVGQGSAALVRTSDGVCGLVDTGDGSTDVAKLLKKEGVRKLSFIVISHGHSDHYGGLADVLKEYRPDVIFVPDNSFDTYCAQLGACFGVETETVSGFLSCGLGKYARMDLAEPLFDSDNLNNGSLVVTLSGAWGSIVLPGDAENEELLELEERGLIGDSDVFCLAHHGSRTSGDEKILWEISPKYVIISVGYRNSYGHPSKQVLETLEDGGVPSGNIYRTDRDGAIRVTASVDLFGREFVWLWQKRARV